MRTVCPSSYPACFNARWMAATGPDGALADEEARNPTTGIVIAGCCARAANGHAAAAPPSNVINSRRFNSWNCIQPSQAALIQVTRRPELTETVVFQFQAPWPLVD